MLRFFTAVERQNEQGDGWKYAGRSPLPSWMLPCLPSSVFRQRVAVDHASPAAKEAPKPHQKAQGHTRRSDRFARHLLHS
mmetsp:Transcript_28994/g.29371  ORF Transcript_28994/g.29371 Transcript_28994/m.29371 type:complete len:80 (-) Transcript_28994:26-265(-)